MTRRPHIVRSSQPGAPGVQRELALGAGYTILCDRAANLRVENVDVSSTTTCEIPVSIEGPANQRLFAASTISGVRYKSSRDPQSCGLSAWIGVDRGEVAVISRTRIRTWGELMESPPNQTRHYAGYGCMTGIVDLPPRPGSAYVINVGLNVADSPTNRIDIGSVSLQLMFGQTLETRSDCASGWWDEP